MGNDAIRNMLTPVHRKVVLQESEQQYPVFQSLMDKAYARWRKGGDLEGKGDAEFVAALPEDQELAVRVGNMNYQVENGGWAQWYGNGYGKRDEEWLMDFFDAHKEYAAFSWMARLLSNVAGIAEGPFDVTCDWCGGDGETEIDDETGEGEVCDQCHGDGTIETDDLDNVEADIFDKQDGTFYEGNDKLMAAMEQYLSGKHDDIGTTPAEEPAPAAKVKPKVRLTGQDGNAFAVLGKVIGALKKAGYSKEEVDEFKKEAMSGDYNHLLATAMKWADVS